MFKILEIYFARRDSSVSSLSYSNTFLVSAFIISQKWQIFFKKQTRWPNDKTIIELGYRKLSRFVSDSQINYLPQPSASANYWSACH